MLWWRLLSFTVPVCPEQVATAAPQLLALQCYWHVVPHTLTTDNNILHPASVFWSCWVLPPHHTGCLCRVPTTYDPDSKVLTIKHTPECDAVQYAYFAPYTYNRHRNLIARMQVRRGVARCDVLRVAAVGSCDALEPPCLPGVGAGACAVLCQVPCAAVPLC